MKISELKQLIREAVEEVVNEMSLHDDKPQLKLSVLVDDVDKLEQIAKQYQLTSKLDNQGWLVVSGDQGQLDAFVNHVLDSGFDVEVDDKISASGPLKENANGTGKMRWNNGNELEVSNETNLPVGNVEFLGDIESPAKDAPTAKDWHIYSVGNKEYVYWSPSTKKAFKTKVAKMMSWGDGVRVDMDETGNPIGYKNLGWLNSGIKVPEAKDWREFYSTTSGHEKSLSPSLKMWYQVDSSG